MSPSGYDGTHLSSNYSRYDQRRYSGSMNNNYDRQPAPISRRGTPSPGPSRRPYDPYAPPRSDSSFRDPPAILRQSTYRSDYYYSRSPSPDQYQHQPRSSDSDPWGRSTTSWRPPSVPVSHDWSDRKSLPPSPTATSLRRPIPREEFPSAPSRQLFEPSEHWKQTHADTSRNDMRNRSSIDASSEKSSRNDRVPHFIPNERYRPPPPPPKHNSLPSTREYDPHRPPYSDNKAVTYRREPAYDHISPYTAPHQKPSMSPGSLHSPAAVSPVHSPNWSSTHGSEHQPWSYSSGTDLSKRDNSALRPPSRSSIASTQVSGRNSPSLPVSAPAIDLTKLTSIVPHTVDSMSGIVEHHVHSPIMGIPPTKEENHAMRGQSQVPSSTPMIPDLPTNIPEVMHSPSPREMSRDDDDDAIPGLTASLISSATPVKAAMEPEGSATLESGPNETPQPHVEGHCATPPQPESESVVPDTTSPELVDDPMEVVEEPPAPAPDADSVNREVAPSIQEDTIEPEPVPIDSPLLTSQGTPEPEPEPFPTPADIPPIHSAKTKEDALRIVVMARLLCDRQSREERVDPILIGNLSIASIPEVHPTANPESLLDKMFAGQAMKRRSASFARTRPNLSKYFEQREAMVEEKQARLREEYLTLHEDWIAHCNALNEQQKTLASELEVHHTGRTTRRTAAVTDIIRSDFEMEQIIASLGNDDATDPNHLSIKNVATIPDMISATHGKVDYLFDDTSHRVQNPREYYAPYTGMHDWTEEEKRIFVDKYAAHPKQFGIIADYLPNKSAAQCVAYYYLHKKRHIDFRKIVSQFAPNKRRRRGMGKKKGNALLADIAQHDFEVGRNASGGASSPSAGGRTRGRRTAAEARKAAAAARRNVQFEHTPAGTPTPEPEVPRTRRRKPAAGSALATATTNPTPADSASASATPAPPSNVLPSVSVASTPVPPSPHSRLEPSISATPVSSGQPTAVNEIPPLPAAGLSGAAVATMDEGDTPDQDGDSRPAKRAKRSRKIKSAAMVSEEEHSDAGKGSSSRAEGSGGGRGKKDAASNSSSVTLSKEETEQFVRLFETHGEDFAQIAAYMPNMTAQQALNFYKANPAKFEKPKPATRRTSDAGTRVRNYSTAQTPLDLRPHYPVPMMTHPGAHMSTPMNPYVTYATNPPSHPMMDGRLHHYPTSAPTSPGWGLVTHHAMPGGIAPYPGLSASLPMARLGDAPHQMSDPNMVYNAPPPLGVPFAYIAQPPHPQGSHQVPPRSASETGYHYGSRPATSHSPSGVDHSYNSQSRPPNSQGQGSQGYHSRTPSFQHPQSPPASSSRKTPTLHQPKASHPSSSSNVVIPVTHSPEPGVSSYHKSGAFAGSATPPPMNANGRYHTNNPSREESVPYVAPVISPVMSSASLPTQTARPTSSSGRYSYEGSRDEFGGGPYYPNSIRRGETAYPGYPESGRSSAGPQPNSSTGTPPASTSTATGAPPRPSGYYQGWTK